MDVMDERDIDKVVVLGCGISISDLKDEEIQYINRCKTVVAMNKFAAFYDKVNIIPTHIYFTDTHENSNKLLQYIITKMDNDEIYGLTYILHKEFQGCLLFGSQKPSILHHVKAKMIRETNCIKYMLEHPKGRVFTIVRTLRKIISGLVTRVQYLRVNKKNYFNFVFPNIFGSVRWATELNQFLFHYKGSLSSVLNYISIIRPGAEVLLVGTDFYSGEYFFENELESLNIPWKDWTTKIVREKGIHISALPFTNSKNKTNEKCKTLFERFDEIIEGLDKTSNNIYVCNPKSLLAIQAGVPVKALPNFSNI